MKKLQELETWFDLAIKLNSLPKELRSQNFTAFNNEVQYKVYELVEELGLDEKDWQVNKFPELSNEMLLPSHFEGYER